MAMYIRAEELMLTIETTLCKATENKLKETADYLKVPDIDRLSKGALIRKIHEHLDGLCETEKTGLRIYIHHWRTFSLSCVVPLRPWKRHRRRIHSY